jgi:hypothetical protein
MKQPWEVAAAAVAYPVVTVVDSLADRPHLSHWVGEPEAPTSVTVRYERDGLQVTSYSQRLWGSDKIWDDLWGVVESTFGSWWSATELQLNFDELTVDETMKTPTESGHAVFTTYKPLSSKQEDEMRLKRERAASDADHREVEIEVNGSPVPAKLVSERRFWAAGFETSFNGAPVVGLLNAEGTPPESLRLRLVANLLTYLRA